MVHDRLKSSNETFSFTVQWLCGAYRFVYLNYKIESSDLFVVVCNERDKERDVAENERLPRKTNFRSLTAPLAYIWICKQDNWPELRAALTNLDISNISTYKLILRTAHAHILGQIETRECLQYAKQSHNQFFFLSSKCKQSQNKQRTDEFEKKIILFKRNEMKWNSEHRSVLR